MQVEVSAGVIEQSLQTGARHRACEVIDGLPEGAVLTGVAFDALRQVVRLQFRVPGEDDPGRVRAIEIRTED